MGFNLGGALTGALTAGLTGGWGGAAMLAGAIGGGAGQGPSSKPIKNPHYDIAFDKAVKLYDTTDFDKIDEEAMKVYGEGATKEGVKMLEGYDARAAGAGSPISKLDTNKELARASIAGEVGADISAKKAELMLTRPSRKRALLPGLDQNSNLGILNRPGNIDSLMQLGALDWGGAFKRRKNYGGGMTQTRPNRWDQPIGGQVPGID